MRRGWNAGPWRVAAGLLWLAAAARAGDPGTPQPAAAEAVPVSGPEGTVSEMGARLAGLLDSMEVEKHWLAGHHVSWRTGDPDGRPVPATGYHSHCSAFVAAAASRLGVPILEPPEHPQVLLANAQCRWLRETGPERAWTPVPSALEAQRRANAGDFVVACTVNPEHGEPGHIAIVRPAALDPLRIEKQGPQVIQAGRRNWNSTSLKRGFRHHPAAWARRGIRYYSHPVPDSSAPSP